MSKLLMVFLLVYPVPPLKMLAGGPYFPEIPDMLAPPLTVSLLLIASLMTP